MIFNSYVKLPEGKLLYNYHHQNLYYNTTLLYVWYHLTNFLLTNHKPNAAMPTKNPYRTTYSVAGCKFKMTLSTNSDKVPGSTIPRQGTVFQETLPLGCRLIGSPVEETTMAENRTDNSLQKILESTAVFSTSHRIVTIIYRFIICIYI